jgi:hypothetical protein
MPEQLLGSHGEAVDADAHNSTLFMLLTLSKDRNKVMRKSAGVTMASGSEVMPLEATPEIEL